MPAAPAAAAKPINLAVEGTADFSKMFAAMQRMGTGWGREMNVIQKQSDRATKGIFKDFHKMWGKSTKTMKDYDKLYEKTLKQEDAQAEHLQKAWEHVNDVIKTNEKRLARLATIKIDPMDPKALSKLAQMEKVVAIIKTKLGKLNDKRSVVEDTMSDFEDSGRKGSETIKAKLEPDVSDMREAGQKFGESVGGLIAKPLEALFHKDLPGMAKLAAKYLGTAGNLLAKPFDWMKGGLDKRISAKKDKGQDPSMLMKGMSAALGGISSTLKAVGPMLSMTAGAVMGLVQLFLSADAAAKDFNKEVMATGGSAEFLYKNMGNANAASEDMSNTLSEIHDQATSWKNMKFGITKEQYSATIGALEAEGQSLSMLKKSFRETNKEGEVWTGIVTTSVAYSRAFGVSLQEIGQLTGEMMSQMGTNLDGVTSSFQYVIDGANEAGMASNKFFEIVRGFSADLTLFSVRMDSVTHVMTALGKAMNSKDAQKFLGSLTSHFKGKGLAENTKNVLMMGGPQAEQKRSQEEEDVKQTALLAEIAGKATDDDGKTQLNSKSFKKILGKNVQQLAKWLATSGKNLSAGTKRAIIEAAGEQSKITSGTAVDLAAHLDHLSPIEVIKRQIAQGAQFGITLDKAAGIDKLALEQLGIMSSEDQDHFKKLATGVELMKAEFVSKMEENIKSGKEALEGATADQIGAYNVARQQNTKDIAALEEQLKKAKPGAEQKALQQKLDDLHKLEGKGQEAALVQSKNALTVWENLSPDKQKLLSGVKDEVNFQEKTANLTTSLNTQIEILVDFLMGAFYNNIMKMVKGVQKLSLTQDDDKEQQLSILEREAVAKGDGAMLKALKESGGDMEQLKKLLGAPLKKLQDELAAAVNPEDKEAIQKEIDALGKVVNAQVKAVEHSQKVVNDASDDRASAKVQGQVMGAALLPVLGPIAPYLGGKVAEALGPTIMSLERAAASWFGIGQNHQGSDLEAPKPGGPAPGAESLDLSSVLPNKKDAEAGDAANVALANAGVVKKESIATHDRHLERLMEGTPDGLTVDQGEEAQDESEDQGGTLDDIWKALRVRGIKIDKPFLENSIKPVFRDAVYDAAGEALEDYFLMTQHSDVAEAALKAGVHGAGQILHGGPEALAKATKDKMDKDAADAKANAAPKTTMAPGHAAGGLVTGIGSDGMAQVSPAPGEGFASIGKGERISPAGAGGGGGKQVIELVLKGDLGRIIDVRAQNVVSNHETMKSRR
jgi:hypothetical protein